MVTVRLSLKHVKYIINELRRVGDSYTDEEDFKDSKEILKLFYEALNKIKK